MMTNVLQDKPADPKAAMLKMLSSLQKKQFNKTDPHNNSLYQFQGQFLNTEDFESIFDSYDVLQIQQIPVSYLYHALKIVGVDQAEEIVALRYQSTLEDETINKVSFVFILEQEHKRNGFLNSGIWMTRWETFKKLFSYKFLSMKTKYWANKQLNKL